MGSALLSDLGLICLLVVCSGLAVTVALWAAPMLGMERLALAVSGLVEAPAMRYSIAATLSGAILCVMLGIVPGPALLQGWVGPAASVAVMLCLLAVSIAAVAPPSAPKVVVTRAGKPAAPKQEPARQAA